MVDAAYAVARVHVAFQIFARGISHNKHDKLTLVEIDWPNVFEYVVLSLVVRAHRSIKEFVQQWHG